MADQPVETSGALEEVRFLQIEPTTRCNMTCGYCCGRHMEQADLSMETFEAALAAFPRLEHLELQGEGEPLLHPRFFDLAARAKERGLEVSFITNGSLLSPEVVERILDGGFEAVLVSIDSPRAEAFRALRGAPLDKVLEGTRRLVERRRARGLALPSIGMAATILRSTQEDLPALVSLYRQLGLDGGLGTQVLNPMPCYLRHYGPELRRELVPPREHWAYLAELRALPAVREALDGSNPKGFFSALFWGWEPGRRRCPWLERGVYVDHRGAVTGCCMIKDAEHAYGTVGRQSLAELDAGREALRGQLARGETPVPCRGCDVVSMALEGVDPATGLSLVDAFKARDLQSWAVNCRSLALRSDLDTRLRPLLAEQGIAAPPAAADERVRRLEAELALAKEQCRRVLEEIEALRSSKSWKLTGPVRRGLDMLLALKRRLP